MSAGLHRACRRLMGGRNRWILSIVGAMLAWSLGFIAPRCALAEEGQADISLTLAAQVGTRDGAPSAQEESTSTSGSLQVETGDGLVSVVIPFALAGLFASAALVLLVPPKHARVGKGAQASNSLSCLSPTGRGRIREAQPFRQRRKQRHQSVIQRIRTALLMIFLCKR